MFGGEDQELGFLHTEPEVPVQNPGGFVMDANHNSRERLGGRSKFASHQHLHKRKEKGSGSFNNCIQDTLGFSVGKEEEASSENAKMWLVSRMTNWESTTHCFKKEGMNKLSRAVEKQNRMEMEMALRMHCVSGCLFFESWCHPKVRHPTRHMFLKTAPSPGLGTQLVPWASAWSI